MSKSLKNLLGVDNKFQTDGGEETDGAHVEAETVFWRRQAHCGTC